MQPFQYDLRCSAAKGNSITHTATLHGKTQGFVLRLPPQNIAHATFMQPFQCNLQPEIQEPNRTMHTDTTTRCKNTYEEQFAHKTTPAAPAAQTRYLSSSPAATLHGKTQGFVLRLPPQNIAHATFMQPLQCNLQPQLQRTKRPQPHPPHRRGTFHRRLQPLYTEKHKVSCSGFLPKICNIHAAITMRFAASRCKPAPIYARGNIKWRQ